MVQLVCIYTSIHACILPYLQDVKIFSIKALSLICSLSSSKLTQLVEFCILQPLKGTFMELTIFFSDKTQKFFIHSKMQHFSHVTQTKSATPTKLAIPIDFPYLTELP